MARKVKENDYFPTVSKKRKDELTKLAEKLYKDNHSDVMDDVCAIYPKYNNVSSSDHEEAILEIRERFLDKGSVNQKAMKEDDFNFLADTLNNMISGGLA